MKIQGKFKKIWEGWKEKIGMPRILLLLLCGIALLVLSWPFSGKKETNPLPVEHTGTAQTGMTEDQYAEWLEKKAVRLLESMEGIGRAEVAITLKAGSEKVVQKNVQSSQSSLNEVDQEGGSRVSQEFSQKEEVVLAEGSPYVIQEKKPEIAGIAVCVRGADSPSVISEISEAMQALFDVPAHKIKVLKME